MFKKNHIDMRSEVLTLHSELAYHILYNRTTKYIKCKCFNELYKSGNPRCQICHGNGYLTSLERMEVIEYTPDLKALSASSLGSYSRHEKVFFFSYKAAPKRKDLMLVTGWNKDQTPSNLHEVYEVKDVNVVRGDEGKVEYYRVLAVLVPDLKRQLQDSINRLPTEARRQIARGRRYVWPIKKVKEKLE